MSESWELPLIMNDASRTKYSRYSIINTQSQPTSKSKTKAKRQSRNPFQCLNRNPYACSTLTHAAYKAQQLNYSRHGNSPSIDFTNSLLPTLPPLTSVTAPRGSALKAYEEVHGFAREYLKNCGEETMQELSLLKQLHGSLSSLNRRMDQISQSDRVILDPVLNIIFETLHAQMALRDERMKDAAIHFRKAQFYSLQSRQYLFACYSLLEEAEIYKSQGRLEKGLASLKKALGLSIVFDKQQLQLVTLEKMGMLYYYNGNTAMGEHYHRLAEHGLSPREKEIFGNQFSLQGELRELEEQLFSLTHQGKPQTKQFSRYEVQANSDLQAESVTVHSNQAIAMVSRMLKDSHDRNVGAKLSKHIRNTLSLASIIPHSHSPPHPPNKENLPFFNVSQVLKSHLSKNRGGTRLQRDWQIRTLLHMIDSLCRYLP